ncbi:EamA family transporter [Pannonibacter sp. Pt2-lr]
MSLFGFVGFNMLFYIAAHSTSAVNLGIIQGAMPALVLVGAMIAFGTRVAALQVAGIFVTMTGVALVAAKGDLSNLAALEINLGDGIMLIACVFTQATRSPCATVRSCRAPSSSVSWRLSPLRHPFLR